MLRFVLLLFLVWFGLVWLDNVNSVVVVLIVLIFVCCLYCVLFISFGCNDLLVVV